MDRTLIMPPGGPIIKRRSGDAFGPVYAVWILRSDATGEVDDTREIAAVVAQVKRNKRADALCGNLPCAV